MILALHEVTYEAHRYPLYVIIESIPSFYCFTFGGNLSVDSNFLSFLTLFLSHFNPHTTLNMPCLPYSLVISNNGFQFQFQLIDAVIAICMLIANMVIAFANPVIMELDILETAKSRLQVTFYYYDFGLVLSNGK